MCLPFPNSQGILAGAMPKKDCSFQKRFLHILFDVVVDSKTCPVITRPENFSMYGKEGRKICKKMTALASRAEIVWVPIVLPSNFCSAQPEGTLEMPNFPIFLHCRTIENLCKPLPKKKHPGRAMAFSVSCTCLQKPFGWFINDCHALDHAHQFFFC